MKHLILVARALLWMVLILVGARARAVADEQLGPMLDLGGEIGQDPTKIDFAKLPILAGKHGVVTQGDAEWIFRLHNYLAFFDGKYWCMWSHGRVIEDNPLQHVCYATSTDGLTWSEPGKIVASSPKEGFRYISRGLWVRDGELLAIASHDEAFDATGKVHFFGKSLQLMAFEWDGVADKWKPLGVMHDDAINNFPPAKLPNGQWGMICRTHVAKFQCSSAEPSRR
jgi:hypothetical protein